MTYVVMCEIDADSPRETAEAALRMHRDGESIESVFDVCDETGNKTRIDLSEEVCRECGGPNKDGEGWEGMCGNSADRAEAESAGRERPYSQRDEYAAKQSWRKA